MFLIFLDFKLLRDYLTQRNPPCSSDPPCLFVCLFLLKNENLSEPKFQNTGGGFEVILIGPGKSFEEEIEKQKLHKLELNKRQRKALECLKQKKKITRQVYCKINAIGDTYAKKELNELIQNKIIKRIGKEKKHFIF